MTFLSHNIQFVYEYYRIENQKDSVYAFSAATFGRRDSFLQLFQKFIQFRSPQPLFRNSLISFVAT